MAATWQSTVKLWAPTRLIFSDLGPHFLCCSLGVVPFNTWPISRGEENNCCYELSVWQNDNYFHSKWQFWPFWVKWMPFCAFLQLVTTLIFFSFWDRWYVKWNNTWNSTQNMRNLETLRWPELSQLWPAPQTLGIILWNSNVRITSKYIWPKLAARLPT